MKTAKHLSDYQWLLFGRLLSYSGDLNNSLYSLSKMTHNERINEIIDDLNKGHNLSSVLVKDNFEKEIGFYCRVVDLSEAIEITYDKKQKRKELRNLLFNKLSYSLLIYVASIIVLTLFTDFVLPSMLEITTINSERITASFIIIKIIKHLSLIGLFLSIVTIGYIQFKNRWHYLWMILHRFKSDELIRLVATYQFVSELVIMVDQKIDLMKALELIRYDNKRPLAAIIASQLHNELLKGNNFENSVQNEFFDEGFAAIVIFGIEQGRFSDSLKQYKQIVEQRLLMLINRVAISIQLVCYIFVGLVIINSYQVLLLPLEMLNGI